MQPPQWRGRLPTPVGNRLCVLIIVALVHSIAAPDRCIAGRIVRGTVVVVVETIIESRRPATFGRKTGGLIVGEIGSWIAERTAEPTRVVNFGGSIGLTK